MSEKFTEAPIRNAPCPICNGTTYTWGGATGLTARGRIFWPDKEGFFERLAVDPLNGLTRCRLCESCGNIQVFMERL